MLPLARSVLHNIFVLIVGFAIALLCSRLELFVGMGAFHSIIAIIAGSALLIAGFLLRVWATYYFYRAHMRVISLVPQKTLLTSGPYGFSRNPLYLGGNVCIFFGAALVVGSPLAILVTALHLPLMDLFVRREERQLARDFGDEWSRYKGRVRRWI